MIDQVMKSSSCRDPKMEAYYKEVRRLEDKFHGLELNYVARRYNEATVPPDIFARDLHQPSVDTSASGGANGPPLDPPLEVESPSIGAKVMQTEGSTLTADLEPN
jgi:hypothetical protein